MQQRQNYRNLWHTDLMSTIQQDPPCKLLLVPVVGFLYALETQRPLTQFLLQDEFHVLSATNCLHFLYYCLHCWEQGALTGILADMGLCLLADIFLIWITVQHDFVRKVPRVYANSTTRVKWATSCGLTI
ncbi:PLAC8 family protein [Striga asiatica]|uniref:PLAC8 family protein n=1 Tax=Striga asiatica TaxID=4170 RepID=A0A5A7PJI3_STRAF|nr:PLAC8 family protein [Striga asiatica]